jgi:hypothetical protein
VTSKASGLAVIAVIVFAVGLAGVEPIGIHKECSDGINNDPSSDQHFDLFDGSCLEYPFADGNGETDTPPEDRFNSFGGAYKAPAGYANTFEWTNNFYQNTANPFALPGYPNPDPLWFCASIMGLPFHSWSHFPSVEGSEAAFQTHLATCPP